MFNVENSGRRIVQKSPSWKSRSLNLGNRHRTTLNFADLVPAYWTFAQPGDKFRMDATVLAKFLPLIAPAFSRMKIKTEWFYVPFRQISPPTLRALQDFTPEPQDVSSYFSQLLAGFQRTQTKQSENQQVRELSGFPSIPAWTLNAWLCGETCTRIFQDNNPSNGVVLGSDYAVSKWRNTEGSITISDYSRLGWESLTTYTSKRRASRLMSYMGLPSRVTTMQYNSDVIREDNYTPSFSFSDGVLSLDANSFVLVDPARAISYDGFNFDFVNRDYLKLAFPSFSNPPDFPDEYAYIYRSAIQFLDGIHDGEFSVSSLSLPWYGYATALPLFIKNATDTGYVLDSSIFNDVPTWSQFGNPAGFALPELTTYSCAPVSLLPFQAYQKIYNDFYRDEKLQEDEIRFYPYAVTGNDNYSIVNGQDVSNSPDRFFVWSQPYDITVNNPVTQSAANSGWSFENNKFLNNLFGLRRRNRQKDVLSSSVTSQVVKGQLSSGENETVYNANLYSKLAKFFMKKEFTGSTWAEWLNNFFGVNSNDLLNNNVVFLGGRESVVSISENIQNSESSQTSPQGNRAGLAGDFHNGNEIYFRSPDFGVIMCIVSVIPDDIDNFNGLQERFQKNSVFDFNLPDLQNIGFSPVLNRRANIGLFDGNNSLPPYDFFPSDASKGVGVFGYQPFGYSHTYVPNVISGDLQKSLRFWHQSPDLDFDFTKHNQIADGLETLDYKSWAMNQLSLNANLPTIGLRFQPLGSDLAAQYYNNVFAVTSDESGDHIVADMRFAVTCHRNTAFFTDAVEDEK